MNIHVVLEVADTAKRIEVEPADGQDPIEDFEEAQSEMNGLVRLGQAVFRVQNVAGVICYEENNTR